jgi:hypothetical protein
LSGLRVFTRRPIEERQFLALQAFLLVQDFFSAPNGRHGMLSLASDHYRGRTHVSNCKPNIAAGRSKMEYCTSDLSTGFVLNVG